MITLLLLQSESSSSNMPITHAEGDDDECVCVHDPLNKIFHNALQWRATKTKKKKETNLASFSSSVGWLVDCEKRAIT